MVTMTMMIAMMVARDFIGGDDDRDDFNDSDDGGDDYGDDYDDGNDIVMTIW